MKNVFTLVFVLLFITGCAGLKKPLEPKISIEGIKVEDVNLTRAKIGVDLLIYNPNSYDIVVQDIDYSLFLKGSKVLSDKLAPNAVLVAQQETPIKVPVFVNVFDALNLIGPFVRAKQNPEFTIKGAIDLKNYAFPIKFEKTHTLDLNDPSIRQYFSN